MSLNHGWTPDTAYRAMVGPGVMLANVSESLLTPSTAWNKAAQDAFLASGTAFGASDSGFEFAYSPDYSEWEFAGVPGNVKNGRRLTSAEVRLSGSITEIIEGNITKLMPGSKSVNWSTTETVPTVIGKKITNDGIILDSSYLSNICVVAERQGQKIGGVFIIYNAFHDGDFSLGLDGGEDRSAVDVDFVGTYGQNSQDSTTGGWRVPLSLYLSTPAAAV